MGQMSRISGRATTVTSDDTGTHVTYHHTRVVSFDAKQITLRTGGWRSNTTKARMTQAARQFNLGYRVYQENYAWYVVTPQGHTVPFEGRELVLER